MKKFNTILMVGMLLTALLCSCGTAEQEETGAEEQKLSVVTTIFPEYDWVKQILGDKVENAEITMLLDSGADLHSYQPTAEDLVKISNCDLFLYVGGESDEWVEDALTEAENQDMQIVNLLAALGDSAKEEELAEGMEAEEEGEEAEGEEETEYDEHVWLSLKNAAVLCETIRDALIAVDPDGAEVYTANTASYVEKLEALDRDYTSAVEAAGNSTLLFGDRFPFRYLADDYGLSYYAAFAGCSAESEASFETVAFLAQKLDELALPAVLTIDGSDRKLAETIVSTSKAKTAEILTLNSMQSVTLEQTESGTDYLSVMTENLDVLKAALS